MKKLLMLKLTALIIFGQTISYCMEKHNQPEGPTAPATSSATDNDDQAPPAKVRAVEAQNQAMEQELMAPATIAITDDLEYQDEMQAIEAQGKFAVPFPISVEQDPMDPSAALDPLQPVETTAPQTHNQDTGAYYTCTICKAVIEGRKNFLQHRWITHRANLPYTCTYEGCPYATAKAGDLEQHQKRAHTKEKIFKCPHEGCTYATTTSGRLTGHRRIHSGEKPCKCTFEDCNFAAATKGSLAIHKRTHTGEKPFKCSHEGCTYAATNQGNLARHKKIHTGEKPFKCQQCDHACTQKGDLIEHMRIHTGEKPFKCEHEGCDFASAGSAGLKHHSRTCHPKPPMTPAHIETTDELLQPAVLEAPQAAAACATEEDTTWTSFLSEDDFLLAADDQISYSQFSGIEKTYSCDACCLIFQDYQSFLQHKLTHNATICPHVGCGYTATSLAELREHVQTHTTDDKPY